MISVDIYIYPLLAVVLVRAVTYCCWQRTMVHCLLYNNRYLQKEHTQDLLPYLGAVSVVIRNIHRLIY